MKLKLSLAVQLLLGITVGLNIKTQEGLGDQEVSSSYKASEFMLEPNRFINSKGEPIILAQTTGHARIELRQERKPHEDDSDEEEEESKHIHSQTKTCSAGKSVDHCPIQGNESELKV